MTQLDSNLRTPLHLACIEGNLSQVKQLVQNKCHINRKDKFGWTPLALACQQRHFQIIEFLVQNGSNLNDRWDDKARRPLHLAASKGKIKLVQVLEEKGANLIQGWVGGDQNNKCKLKN